MKKTYMMPSIDVTEIRLENMIAASPNINENGGTTTTSENQIGEDDMAGNRNSYRWDD